MQKLAWEKLTKDNNLSRPCYNLLSVKDEITPKLKKHYPGIHLSLIRQTVDRISNCESKLLNCNLDTAKVREIIMSEQEALMFSRTVFSPMLDYEYAQLFDNLDEKRLGTILFNKVYGIEKQAIDYIKLCADSWLYNIAVKFDPNKDLKKKPFYWARRSLFTKDNMPLLILTDIFYKVLEI